MSTIKTKYFYKILEGYIVAAISVILATGGLWLLKHILEKAHMGLVYLLVVASVAGIAGTRPALFSAVLAFFSWNFFFLLPIFTLTIHDQRDWLLLIVFLVIGIMTGQITGRMRSREADAIAREQDTNALYRAIVSINAQTRPETILRELVEQVLINTNALGCAICSVKDKDNINILAGVGDIKMLEGEETVKIVCQSMKQGKAVGISSVPAFSSPGDTFWPVSISHSSLLSEDVSRFDVFLPMYAADKALGLMYVIPMEDRFFSESDLRLLVAFAGNAANFLERQRLMEETGRAETLRETERLKSVLFSSISHNLKTPLASLNATLSSLRQKDVTWDEETLQEQLAFMAEDLKRVTENIEKLLDLAKLESGSWKPDREWFELREIISTAVRRLPENQYRRLNIDIPDDLPLLWVDTVQISQVIRHLVENALDYSDPSSPVMIGADFQDNNIRFQVEDTGPGILLNERELIFRKFYRGHVAREKSVRGTGLGLSICLEIVQAHGGNISVEDSTHGGARFLVSLPVKGEG
jgi:two-component system sensor histidine kinase KdpD